MHRQAGSLGQPRGKGNAGRLAACNRVKAFIAYVVHDHGTAVIHHLRPHSRECDYLAAVDIDRAFHARSQREGIVGAKEHRFDLDQHARDRTGDGSLVVGM